MGATFTNGSALCLHGGGARWDHCPESHKSHGPASQVYWCRSGVTGSLWGREKSVVSGMSVRCVPQALTWG
jgi:hypothetical protein